MCVNANDYAMTSWNETRVKNKIENGDSIESGDKIIKRDDQIQNRPRGTKLYYIGDDENFQIMENGKLKVDNSKFYDNNKWCLDLVTKKCSDKLKW